MSPAEYQTRIIKHVSSIQNEDVLKQLSLIIDNFMKEFRKSQKNNNEITATDLDEENNANHLTFKEWNKQFEDDGKGLDEIIPEYGMTLREFRMGIYESEKEAGKGIPVENFLVELRSW